MYDFTHCISDALENITHSLCTLEFQDNRRLYDWVLDHLDDFQAPNRTRQYEFSRLNLEYTLMSKRKLNYLVVNNLVSGWDDPRMPTIAGLRRRGFTPASVREFCKRIGVTKQDNLVEVGMLEACIREELNDNAPRAMAVLQPIKIVIENYPEGQSEIVKAPVHPNHEHMGVRELAFGREVFIDAEDFREEANKHYKRLVMGKEVRLRNAYVIKAERCDKDADGNVTTVYCTYDPETLGKNPSDGRKVKGVIQWVEASSAVPAEFRVYGRLFNNANPAAAETVEEVLNPESLVIKHGVVEAGLVNAKACEAYQFEREGYYCADSKDSTADALVFNLTVALRESF